MRIHVIIPAYNEERAIARVLEEIPEGIGVEEVIVTDNASTDDTAAVARAAGATVVSQPKRGYGNACLKAMQYIAAKPTEDQPDIVVFLDGDHSDYPAEMANLVLPLKKGTHDLVIGSRTLGTRERGSMTPQQIFGNWLATRMIRYMYGIRFTDLGPFRAIRYSSLLAIDMQDKTYGWTVEMQVKAARQNLRCIEVPVNYRSRIGVSKVSGTVKGTILAGYKIITTIFKYR